MTNGKLLKYLESEAKRYRIDVLEFIVRNRHMNELTASDIKKIAKQLNFTQRIADAILVDFINQIAFPGDLGLYVKHLKESPKTEKISPEIIAVLEKYKKRIHSKKGKKEMEKILREACETKRKLKEARRVSAESLSQKMTI